MNESLGKNVEVETLNLQNCTPHSITLKFPISALEYKFNQIYRQQAHRYYQLVSIYLLLFMVMLSITGIFIEFSVDADMIQKLLWFSYIPLTLILTITLLFNRFANHYCQHIIVSYIFLAGIIGIIFPRTQSIEFVSYYAHSYTMLVCFLIFPLSRLKIINGLTLATFLIILFIIVMKTMPEYSNDDLLWQLRWIIGATLFSFSIGYIIELNVRRWFLAREIIEDKEKQLRKEHEKLQQSQNQLQKEKELSDSLLLSILPFSIVERLKIEGKSIADGIVECTVLFADLVGFTELAQETGPTALVDLLNEIFSSFDELSDKYDLEKIKTIGDAYMVAGGVPNYFPNHAPCIANMALNMREVIHSFNAKKNLQLNIRIGIHTGPVIAGIIGTKKFSYDLWGDAVNLASRMESHALPGKIQVTEATYLLLKKEFEFTERGIIEIKGKGKMRTYFLEHSI